MWVQLGSSTLIVDVTVALGNEEIPAASADGFAKNLAEALVDEWTSGVRPVDAAKAAPSTSAPVSAACKWLTDVVQSAPLDSDLPGASFSSPKVEINDESLTNSPACNVLPVFIAKGSTDTPEGDIGYQLEPNPSMPSGGTATDYQGYAGEIFADSGQVYVNLGSAKLIEGLLNAPGNSEVSRESANRFTALVVGALVTEWKSGVKP